LSLIHGVVPTSQELGSGRLVHRPTDLFNPPGLTNFLGCIQADLDVTGFRALSFPPFATGDMQTAGLYLDGEYFPASGAPVSYTWYPDRIEREAEFRGIRLRTTLALAAGRTAGVMRITAHNESGGYREVKLRLRLRGGITQTRAGWEFLPPGEKDNRAEVDPGRGAVIFSARDTPAVLVQGIGGSAHTVDPRGVESVLRLRPGQGWQVDFVFAVAATAADALALYDEIRDRAAEVLAWGRAVWDREIEAAFTPGNGTYSGSLPVLETDDEAIRRLYYTAAVGLIYFRRDNPMAPHGRAYDTLMPRYWQTVTFLWDYALSGLAHALLDPVVQRRNLERWMQLDMHEHFGTEYLGGEAVGPWYSVNDYAMLQMAREYLRWSGDRAWLDRPADGGGTIRDRLGQFAITWKGLRKNSLLADYGGIGNLLECVTTYVHEVAALNAANVWAMRFAAELLPGRSRAARGLRQEADVLVREVMQLYLDGTGYWAARHPDGDVPVRHCYDFITVLNTINWDLAPRQRREMVDFFGRELMTRTWMRALSSSDEDAISDMRPDHQWTGAYTAWPAQALMGLFNAGEIDMAVDWMRRLALSANQGPFGQAHMVETAIEPDAGGARKAPPTYPWLCDWACSSSGAWLNTIIEGLFGVWASHRDGIQAWPRIAAVDPGARLRDLAYQGRLYTVTAQGVRKQ
jgi:hypothetical protein